MNALSTARSFLHRAAHSILGASVCALGAAVLDASWARAAASGTTTAARQGGLAVYLADAGLLAPIAIAVGIAAAVGGIVLDPERPPSPARFIGAVRLGALGRPAAAAFVPLAVLAGFFWMTFSAHLARALLGLEVGPALAGVAIATGSLGLGLLLGLAALALTPPLRRALANASEGYPACVDPAVTGAVALGVAGALFAFGVATGGVSGEGGLFGIYGIFKRSELDLRAPAELLAIALGGLFAPAALDWVRPLGALLVGLAPALLTARDASALNASPALAQAIERGAPLGRPALAALRKVTDRDRDGYSGSFGGGDCDDRNAKVNPGATEIPDNGVDEDCSGADLSSAAIARLTPSAPPAPRKPPSERPKLPADLNLIIITIDTLRADLHFAGNPHDLSPNLDKLAARSVVFDRAYALASYTGKSVGPMMAGKYGSETHRNWAHSNAFTKEDTFLAERLKQAGFHTMSVQAMNYFGAQSGLHRGFEVMNMSAAAAGGLIKDMENNASGDRVTDAALKLLASPDHSGKRFFLWAHYLDPHADYLHHDDLPKFGSSARDLYDGEVAFVDKHVGRFLDAIAAAPWGQKTMIVITSDHGEAFGEHKMWRHGFELWEELVRVPLLVYVPGVKPTHVAARRSAIDLVPTLLELLHVPAPGHDAKGNDFLSGVSMVPDLFLEPGEKGEERDVLMDMPDGPYNDPRRSLIHGDLKLTVSNNSSYELYDLAKDPEERENLWSKESPESQMMTQLYAAQKARLREIRVTGEKKTP